MKMTPWRILRQRFLLAATMGVTDGILTALVLAAGLLTSSGARVTLGLSVRVAGVAFFSGAFVYFVSKYAESRQQLVHAEQELSLTAHGKLAVTHLGKASFREAVLSALISSAASFLGALCPLLVATLFPQDNWTSVLASLVALGVLGAALAKTVYGNMLRWSLTLILGGMMLTAIGMKLDILQ